MQKYTLKVIRAMNELSQGEMAEKLGITRQYYCRIENRHIPIPAKILVKLCKEFGFDLDQIAD